MSQPWVLLAAIAGLGFAYVLVPIFLVTYSRFRAASGLLSPLLCPVRRERACVGLDALHPGLTDACVGRPRLRVKRCSLWPARAGCTQGCLRLLR